MSEYSIYTITDEDRQFSQSCAVVHCADDVEAIETAAQWLDIHDVELWESNRFITRLHAANVQMLVEPVASLWATLNEGGPAVQ